jgi:biopolymer transport protein ExbB/TolQ
VRKGDLTAARRLCAEAKSPTTAVACAILDAQSRDEQKLTAAADGAAVLVLPPLSRRIPHLNMLANTATLLGLLGTIFGLMTAFSAVGAADPSQRSTFLASGIAQALNTTAFGLIVAVPTILVQGFLVERVEGIVARIDEVTVRLIETLTRGGQPASALPAGTPARRQVA